MEASPIKINNLHVLIPAFIVYDEENSTDNQNTLIIINLNTGNFFRKRVPGSIIIE